MKTLNIELAERSYPIHIGDGLLQQSELWSELIAGHPTIMIVTSEVVGPRYLDSLRHGLGVDTVTTTVLPDGEQYKTLETWRRIIDRLVNIGAGRDGLIIALGGGVIGDMAGFAAASYMRGTPFIQAPTTLLAQVDSSVGGKTGVNHPGGKNLIGAFYQPKAVVSDTRTLKSLPEREFRAGLAEVVKHAVIADAGFFDWLTENAQAILALDAEVLAHAIQRCCEIKAEVVAADEREQGRRAVLNLGHTFGHAIEAATQFRQYRHGEAVAIGMMLAARLAVAEGLCDDGLPDAQARLLGTFGLPVDLPADLDPKRLGELMHLDKKARGGRVRFVLPDAIGRVSIRGEISPDSVQRILAQG